MHLGDKLKLYRKKRNLDQPQMAEKVGVSYRTYQEIERTGIIKKSKDITSVKRILEENEQIIADPETQKEPTFPAKELSTLIESNLSMSRSIEKNSNSLADLVQMLKEKSVPNSDLIVISDVLKKLDLKIGTLLQSTQAGVGGGVQTNRGIDEYDRDKAAAEIARRNRQSGKHGPDKLGS